MLDDFAAALRPAGVALPEFVDDQGDEDDDATLCAGCGGAVPDTDTSPRCQGHRARRPACPRCAPTGSPRAVGTRLQDAQDALEALNQPNA
ncbi:hypothetical protein GCM10011608_55620 [Micromonospora sonchi]|uniref:Uncharacterized protein n=1 Tax=Micromonospora sonchi TaxID=1763543 RepID=A0A917U8W0_9ACTN|nr:hypothetical protein GCM10011608_55620 [Micromonospora sonchi]